MKTPREILFARHHSAEPRLDAIRQEAVAAVRDRRALEAKTSAVADRRYNEGISFWRELFFARPQAWAGLAALWVLIFALKLSTHDASHVIGKKSSVSPDVIAEVQQQKRFFAELVGATELRAAEPPKSFSPRPRSERRYENMTA